MPNNAVCNGEWRATGKGIPFDQPCEWQCLQACARAGMSQSSAEFAARNRSRSPRPRHAGVACSGTIGFGGAQSCAVRSLKHSITALCATTSEATVCRCDSRKLVTIDARHPTCACATCNFRRSMWSCTDCLPPFVRGCNCAGDGTSQASPDRHGPCNSG